MSKPTFRKRIKWVRPSPGDPEQMCRKCLQVKPTESFPPSKAPHGRSWRCMECRFGGPIEFEYARNKPGGKSKIVRAGGRWWRIYSDGISSIPTKYCNHCGHEFPGVTWGDVGPRKFCCKKCAAAVINAPKRQNQRGERNPKWKGGKAKNRCGYIEVMTYGHPGASKKGHVLEHRLVMESVIGRYLSKDETVHHKNGLRDDNRPENLELRCGIHPQGTEPEHLVPWAREILARYGHLHPEVESATA